MMATSIPQQLVEGGRWSDEARWRSVAREIAMDNFPVDMILRHHNVSDDEWAMMERSNGFQAMLREAIGQWNSSLNTKERIELKTLAMLEGTLEELYRALHDPRFADNAKVELFKALSRNVGIGTKDMVQGAVGEKFTISINMGADQGVRVEHTVPKTIEGELVDG